VYYSQVNLLIVSVENTNGVYDRRKAVKNGKYSLEILSFGCVENTVPLICYSKRLKRILSLKKVDLRNGSYMKMITIMSRMNTLLAEYTL
jgi:hypothetical protein